jgi:hypothetical protein
MIRFEIALLALALGVTSVACGGSQAPAKDPSSDPAATEPPAPETASKPPPPPADSPALGGTGTGSAQGSGALGR